MDNKSKSREEMANSYPKTKAVVSRTHSTPIFSGDTARFGAELRRRSDNFCNSFELMHEGGTQPRERRSTMSSEEGNSLSESLTDSPVSDKSKIDAWLEWRKNRRTSLPTFHVDDPVGSAV